MDENVVPVPEACCELCSGNGGTQTLYSDISRTAESGCPAFFLSYATGVGWICQFHSDDGMVASDDGMASIAYLAL
jgi:hypothetical protein